VQEWRKCGPAQLFVEHNNNIKKEICSRRPEGAQGRKCGLVLEHNNNIKKDRAFEHLLTEGENQQGAAATVHVAGGRYVTVIHGRCTCEEV